MHDNSVKHIIFGSYEEFNAAVAKYIGDGYTYTKNHLIHPENEIVIKVSSKLRKFTKKKISVRPTGSSRFFKTISWDGVSGSYLHRVKWEVFRGPIPTGWVIKFKDGNCLNTDLSNLECISRNDLSSETITNTRKKYGRVGNRNAKGPWYYCFETKKVYCGQTATYQTLGIKNQGSAITDMVNGITRRKKGADGKYHTYAVRSVRGYTFRKATEDEIREWKEANCE